MFLSFQLFFLAILFKSTCYILEIIPKKAAFLNKIIANNYTNKTQTIISSYLK